MSSASRCRCAEAGHTQLQVGQVDEHQRAHQGLVVAEPPRPPPSRARPSSRASCGRSCSTRTRAVRLSSRTSVRRAAGDVRAAEQPPRPGDDLQRGREAPRCAGGPRPGGTSTSAVATGSSRRSRRGARGRPRPTRSNMPGELAQVADRRPQPGPVGIRDPGHPAAHVEGRLEVVGGVGVGVRRPGQRDRPAGRSSTCAPRRRPGRSAARGRGSRRRGRCSAARAPRRPSRWTRARTRKARPVVGRVADQAVAEPEPVRAVGLDERRRAASAWRGRGRGRRPRGCARAPRAGSCDRAPRSSAGSGATAGASSSIWVLIAAWTDSGSCVERPGAQGRAG